ncbi:hypothetical protein [Liquorilactobacillus hordei]|uniref:hypothetical protein n=1 Tax=Liquorilactobacillus hordei TaxID=468911 RepID=UPI0039E74121
MFAYIYILLLLFSLIFALYGKNDKKQIIIVSIFFAILAGEMVPKPGIYIDTVRFFSTLDTTRLALRNYGLKDAYEYLFNYLGYNSTPVMGILIMIVAVFNYNGLLLAIAAFVDVYCGYNLVLDGRNGEKNRNVAAMSIFFFFSVFIFSAAVPGVRANIVCSLLVLLCHKKINKNLTWIPFLFVAFLLVLIHPFTLVILLLFFVPYYFGKEKLIMLLFYLILLFQGKFQSFIFAAIYKLTNIPFFSSLYFKSNQYFGVNAYIDISSDSLARYFLRMIVFSLIFLTVLSLHKFRLNKFDKMFAGTLFLAIGALNDTVLFTRCIDLMFFLVLPYLNILLVELFDGKRIRSKISRTVLIFAIIIFSIFSLIDNVRAGTKYNNISTNLQEEANIGFINNNHYI